MPSLKFPDTGTRYVELVNGRPAINQTGHLYADEALTVVAEAYADVNGTKGALLPVDDEGRRYITLDAYGRQVDYWGPESGQDHLWIVINGVKSRVDADYNARIDVIAVRVDDLETAAVDTGDLSSAVATAVQRVNHTGTQSADTLTDGATNRLFTTGEKTKLSGVATGATVNSTDAQLRDRSTHTGAQAISTVTGLQSALDAKEALTGYGMERVFPISFGTSANEKADIYFTGNQWATLEVTLVSLYSASNSSGALRATYSLAGTSTGTVHQSSMQYESVQGFAGDHYALMPAVWDAGNSRWKFTVAHRTTSANPVSVRVRWLSPTSTYSNNIRDSIGVSAVYTTDATVPAVPAVSAVQKGELVLNAADFGVARDNTGNAATGIQQAIDSFPTSGTFIGGTLLLPPGTYRVTTPIVLKPGVSLVGAGRRASRINSASGAGVFTWTADLSQVVVRDLYLSSSSGHIFAPSGGDWGIYTTTVTRCVIVQQDTTKSIMHHVSARDYDNVTFSDCDITRAAGSTVPGFNIVNSAGAANANRWQDCWAHSQNSTGAPFIRIESTSPENYAYDNVIRNITGEQNAGGLIDARSTYNLLVENVTDYDTTATYSTDIIRVGKSATGGLRSVSTTIISSGRRDNVTLPGGIYDVNLVPTENRRAILITPNHSSSQLKINYGAADSVSVLNFAPGAISGLGSTTTHVFGGQAEFPDGITVGGKPITNPGEVNAADPRYGTPGTRAAFIAAMDAAEAMGKHTIVRIPAGLTVDVGNGLSLSGYSVLIRGAGAGLTSGGIPNASVIKASTQTGPVLDYAGWVYPAAFRGKVTALEGVYIQGSGVADATKVRSGLRVDAIGSSTFRDISISGTGGPCLDLTAAVPGFAVYLCDFERFTLFTPVSAKANDVPYVRGTEHNGNRFYAFGLRSTSTGGADCGVSGAAVFTGSASYPSHDNKYEAWWWEFLHVADGGTFFRLAGNQNIVSDFQWFDCLKETGAANTSYFRLDPSPISDFGGNEIRGVIPGHNTGVNPQVDMGVDVYQSRNTIVGTKSFNGENVRLNAGVDRTFVHLRGGVSGAAALGWIDNSGMTNNHLIDEYAQVEVRPAGWLLNSLPTLTPAQIGQRGVALASGEANADRRSTTAAALAASSGQVVLTYFTATVTETVNQIVMWTTGTAAAGLTLVRYGVWSVASNGNLTLVASTANDDLTLLSATNTRYPKALQAAWSKTAGQRYAVGYLCVGTTQPTLLQVGATTLAIQDVILGEDPRHTGTINAQTDLPASVTAGSVTTTRRYPYVEMLP